MKKLIVSLMSVAVLCTMLFTGCAQTEEPADAGDADAVVVEDVNAEAEVAGDVDADAVAEVTSTKNFSDEMKIPYGVDLHEYGADSVERMGDHEDSPYFTSPDFYNMTSTDSLTIISNYETMQQTSEWSCGITSVVMALNHFDMLGDHTEETLAAMRSNGMDPAATTLFDIVDIMESFDAFNVESTYDYEGDAVYEYMTLDKIQELLANGQPIMIAWNDWGGHWQTIIGYDNMGTADYYGDDVMIVADSYDTTDHNQDGYGIYPAERFYYNWTMYDFFEDGFGIEERDMLFCTVSLK